jgi:hypothetical protein
MGEVRATLSNATPQQYVIVIRLFHDYLGEENVCTRNHYAQANLETKREALEQANPSLRGSKPPRGKRDTDLLAWLDSL